MGLSSLFDSKLLPLAVDAGVCIFKLMLVSGAYILMRGGASDAIKKVKSATLGYLLLKIISTYVKVIDTIADGIEF